MTINPIYESIREDIEMDVLATLTVAIPVGVTDRLMITISWDSWRSAMSREEREDRAQQNNVASVEVSGRRPARQIDLPHCICAASFLYASRTCVFSGDCHSVSEKVPRA